MRTPKSQMCSTAVAALLSLPFATGAVFAQQSQGQADQSTTQSNDTAQQQTPQARPGSGKGSDAQQGNAVVAKVGDTEIRGSDVLAAISMLPPRMQEQPPHMLVPMALEQLILRELVLTKARGENLGDDPEVKSLVESTAQTAEEDAMIRIWLNREMKNAVTEKAVQKVYDEAKAQGQQNLPPMEQVRPQIEQQLRQQAILDIQTQLSESADVVLFDPSGQPIGQQQGGSTQQGQDGQNSGGNGSGNTSAGQSGGGASSGGSSGNSGDQPKSN